MNDVTEPSPAGGGALAANIVHFARALREAGVPLGPGAVLDALAAVEAVGFGNRLDFHATLHAVFVKKHEHSLLFDQAFAIFWKRRGLLEKLIAMASPQAPSPRPPQSAEAGASRVADALFKSKPAEPRAVPSIDLDARFTVSDQEILRAKDFAQMSAAEIEEARKLIRAMVMPDDRRRVRRFVATSQRFRIDPRRSFRRSLLPGGAIAPRLSGADRARSAGGRALRHLRLDERIHEALPSLPACARRNAAGLDLPLRNEADQRDAGHARPRSRRGARPMRDAGGRLVRRHAHQRRRFAIQPRLGAARARSGRHRVAVHRWTRTRRRRRSGPRGRAAAPDRAGG